MMEKVDSSAIDLATQEYPKMLISVKLLALKEGPCTYVCRFLEDIPRPEREVA